MTWMIVKIIIGVAAVTAFFTWTMWWYIRSSVSENPKIRGRGELVSGLMSLGLAVYYVVQAAKGKEPKLAGILFGLVIAWWLFCGAIFLLRRKKA
jgi:hypothetical protein